MTRYWSVHRGIVLAAVALVSTSCLVWWGDWGDAQLVTLQRSEPLQEEKFLESEIELPVGTLEIEPGPPSKVYELDLEYNERAFEPHISYRREEKTGHFRFELSGEGKSISRVGKTRLNLRLNPEIPLRLEASTGVGETQIDLTNMTVQSVRLESGIAETELLMLEPNRTTCERLTLRSGVSGLKATGLGNFRFKRFEFQGGVGHATLDFSGSWEEAGEVEIEVGVGGVEIRLPRHIGAEIRVSKTFLSGLSISGFQQKSSDTYVSDNIDRVDKVLHLRIRTGIGGIEIRWI